MKRFAVLFLSLLLLATVFILKPVSAEEKKTELSDDSKSAILIERDTGAVLYEKNSREKLPPASMTKVMTMLLVMEALDSGQLKLDEKIRTSEYAASMGGSQIFLEAGEEMTVKELLLGVAIASANDASVALAERIAGNEEAFVEKMNKRAAELGLKDTKFQNTTGLTAKDHYSTAHDMAIMAKELLKHEEITDFTKLYESYLREDTDKKFWLVNTNKLVRFYPGVDGLKTGFTSDAKYCLTATAKKEGMRVIAVVFGAPTSKSRNTQITKMLDYAFSQYASHSLYPKGEVLGKAKISKGSLKEVNAKTAEPISILTKKDEEDKDFQTKVKLHKNLKAPLRKGDEVGEIMIEKNGKQLLSAPLVAEKNVEKANWWQLFKRSFGLFTQSK